MALGATDAPQSLSSRRQAIPHHHHGVMKKMIAKHEQFAASTLDNSELARRVESYLHSKQVRSLRSVRVEAQHGRVVLRGAVGSFYEKQLCLNCTRRVAGVQDLVDEIQVSDPPPRLAAS